MVPLTLSKLAERKEFHCLVCRLVHRAITETEQGKEREGEREIESGERRVRERTEYRECNKQGECEEEECRGKERKDENIV